MSAANKIILGVTGSIAAHKAADLASLLTKAKGDVRAVLTADAHFREIPNLRVIESLE